MKNIENKKLGLMIVFIIISVLFLATSVIFLSFSSDKKKRRVLFVHNDIEHKVYGAPLGIKVQKRWQDDVLMFAKAMVMPTGEAYQRPLFVSGVRVNSVIDVNDITYVSLSMDGDKFIGNREANFSNDLALFIRALEFNFPRIGNFVITVNGLEMS